MCAAFLELRKAYDSRSCDFVEEMGVYDVELKWFQNYLSDRFQRVKGVAAFSDWGPVKGVFLKAVPLIHYYF